MLRKERVPCHLQTSDTCNSLLIPHKGAITSHSITLLNHCHQPFPQMKLQAKGWFQNKNKVYCIQTKGMANHLYVNTTLITIIIYLSHTHSHRLSLYSTDLISQYLQALTVPISKPYLTLSHHSLPLYTTAPPLKSHPAIGRWHTASAVTGRWCHSCM